MTNASRRRLAGALVSLLGASPAAQVDPQRAAAYLAEAAALCEREGAKAARRASRDRDSAQRRITMEVATVFALALAFASPPSLAQQSAPLTSCPLLDTADAAVLTGPGVEFYSGRESTAPGVPKTVLCFFGVGQGRSLTVKTGPSLAKNAAEYRNMFEPLRQMNKAALEPGIGEYAYSTNDGSTATLDAVKGTLVLSLELKGTGLAAADLEKMRAAAKKALGRM